MEAPENQVRLASTAFNHHRHHIVTHPRSSQMPRSGIRPPSKINLTSPVSKLTGLNEMTDARANARLGAMGPPDGIVKRKYTGRMDSYFALYLQWN